MIIRKLEQKDSEQVDSLHKKLYLPKYNPQRTDKINFSEQNFDAKLITYVADDNGKLVGYIVVVYLKVDYIKTGEIWDLFVDEAYRNKGLGSQLVLAVENESKKLGVEYLTLWIDPDPNETDPTEFYEKNGYKVSKHPGLTKKLI